MDEDKIRTEEQKDAYARIVLKKPRPPGSSEIRSAEEKAAYYQLWDEIRAVPGCAKLFANHAEIPHRALQSQLLFHNYKLLKAILERLEAGPGDHQ